MQNKHLKSQTVEENLSLVEVYRNQPRNIGERGRKYGKLSLPKRKGFRTVT